MNYQKRCRYVVELGQSPVKGHIDVANGFGSIKSYCLQNIYVLDIQTNLYIRIIKYNGKILNVFIVWLNLILYIDGGALIVTCRQVNTIT